MHSYFHCTQYNSHAMEATQMSKYGKMDQDAMIYYAALRKKSCNLKQHGWN